MSTSKGKTVTLHDMTLRDGMHPKRHRMTLVQMRHIAQGLDAAGVPLIEVTHGDGLGGSSVNYGFPAHSDEEYLSAVIPLMTRTKVSALLIPGIGTVDHLRMAHGLGVHTMRVATHCTEADVANTPMEVLVAVCERMGIATGVDLWKIQDVAEDQVVPIMDFAIRLDRDALTLGYAGVYGSFLLFAKRASALHGVPARDILV